MADLGAVLAAHPGHVAAAYARGAARHKLGAIEGAIDDFSAVLAADPGHARAAYGRAACYNLAGRFDDANGGCGWAVGCGCGRECFTSGVAGQFPPATSSAVLQRCCC